ncbi:g10058 [Coccomyxa elongata]
MGDDDAAEPDVALAAWFPEGASEPVSSRRLREFGASYHFVSNQLQQLVFIGVDLPKEEVIKVFEACTLTDAELEAGPALWETWSSPWDTL